MSRIVFNTSGSEGDVHPFIAVALRLKARGFHPVIATRDEFRAKVEAEGLEFHAVRPNVAELQERFGLDTAGVWRSIADPITGLRFVLRRTVMAFLKEAYEDVMAATQGASLVVTHSFAFAGRLAAETRGIPWVSAVLQPFNFMSLYDPPMLGVVPLLDALRPLIPRAGYRRIFEIMRRKSEPWAASVVELRRELGLPPYAAHPLFDEQFSKRGTVALYSPLLGSIQPDFPPNTRIVGFPFYDSEHGGGSALAPELAAFLAQGEAPLVFTLGSAAVQDAGDFFAAAQDASRKLGARAVFLTGAPSPADLGPNAIALPYAPHSLLFPKARAVIHQGGIGTTAQALRAGRPQLVVPFMADQPDNAARVTRLGVGQVLSRGRCTGPALAAALSRLERSAAHARRAEAVAATIAHEDGAEAAAEMLAAMM